MEILGALYQYGDKCSISISGIFGNCFLMDPESAMLFQGTISNTDMLQYSVLALLTCALVIASIFLLKSIFDKDETDG